MRKNVKPSQTRITTLAVALALLPASSVYAAGLGKFSVLSAIGQPLRAELEVTATKEELGSLTVRVAPPEAFRQAGIEYASAMMGLSFTLDKRPDGRPYFRVTGNRPVNEPFLDMLVELNWAAGRLVREYTFLLDPPEAFKPQPAVAPVAVPEIRPEPVAAATERPTRRVSPVTGATTGDAPPAKSAPIEPKPSRKAPAEGGERTVKPGETLGKIAAEFRPEGVSLDQMLLALLRNNEDAFIEGNMNRLKAGKILKVPSREEATAIDTAEARKTIVAQAADFNAYRKKLATAVASREVAKEDAPVQAVAGKITPKVQDKVPAPPPGKDKLEVSRTEVTKSGVKPGKADAGAVVAEEDRVAKEKALKEANTRIAELEKNLADLKKLAEMKSAAGAKMQEQAQAPQTQTQAKPAAEPAKPELSPAKPSEAAKPAEAAPETPKPAEAAKPVEAPKPAPKKPAPPPPPEPDFIEDNPGIVFGGGGVLALLLGYLGFSAWRKKKASAASGGSDLSPTSAFGTTAGEDATTGEGAVLTDFSESSPGALASDEGVDPVAEADVYMAYGRDAQAEEILIEALKTDPARHAIYLKLLELYSKRKSVKQFETLASELHGLTGGAGQEWAKAAAMGMALDPGNPLYGGGQSAEPSDEVAPMASAATVPPEDVQTFIQGAPVEMAPSAEAEPLPEETSASLDFDLDMGAPSTPAAAEEAVAVVEVAAPPKAEEEAMSLDFDLDLGSPAEPAAEAAPEVPAESTETGGGGLDIDFDLPEIGATPAVEEAAPAEVGPDAENTIDFELGGLSPEPAPELPAAPAAEAAPAGEGGGLDFDFDLGSAAGEVSPVAEEAPAEPASAPALDLASINLDLEPPAAEPEAVSPVEPEPLAAMDNPEVGTKLELAIAYEEMGDRDGARELLQEVINEGSPVQQATARERLTRLES